MENECGICEIISQIKNNQNTHFVKELETGYVVLRDYQFYMGYVLFLCKRHGTELFELEPDFRRKFLDDMNRVAEAVYKSFKPKKMNYELLGNSEPHLHWHIIPRYEDDPNPHRPVWEINVGIRKSEEVKATPEEIEELKLKLLENLQ